MINILKLRKLEKEKKQQMDPSPEGNDSVEMPQKSAAELQGTENNTEKIKADAPEKKAKARTAIPKTAKTKTAKTKKETLKTPESTVEEVIEAEVQNQNAAVTEQAASASSNEIETDDPLERFRQELIAQVLQDETMITREQLKKELEEEPAKEELIIELLELKPEMKITEEQPDEVESEEVNETFEPVVPADTVPPAPKTEPVIAPRAEAPYKPEPVKKSEPKKQESPRVERDDRIDTKNKKAADSVIQLVGFEIGREYYGIEINRIKEINRMTEITKVPRAPEFIEGVINLRGTVIPVINLRTKVRMPKKAYDKDTRIIIIELKGKTIGFIVDGVREVLRIPENLLAPPPMLSVGKNAEYISAVAKLEDELVILMDPEKVLSNEEAMKIK